MNKLETYDCKNKIINKKAEIILLLLSGINFGWALSQFILTNYIYFMINIIVSFGLLFVYFKKVGYEI